MLKFQLNLWDGLITIEAEDEKELIKKVSFWLDLPKRCDCCGQPGLVRPEYRTPKGFEYYSLKCIGCGARKNLGIKKEDGSLFVRWDEKFEKFDKSSTKTTTKPTTKTTTEESFLNQEEPF